MDKKAIMQHGAPALAVPGAPVLAQQQPLRQQQQQARQDPGSSYDVSRLEEMSRLTSSIERLARRVADLQEATIRDAGLSDTSASGPPVIRSGGPVAGPRAQQLKRTRSPASSPRQKRARSQPPALTSQLRPGRNGMSARRALSAARAGAGGSGSSRSSSRRRSTPLRRRPMSRVLSPNARRTSGSTAGYDSGASNDGFRFSTWDPNDPVSLRLSPSNVVPGSPLARPPRAQKPPVKRPGKAVQEDAPTMQQLQAQINDLRDIINTSLNTSTSNTSAAAAAVGCGSGNVNASQRSHGSNSVSGYARAAGGATSSQRVPAAARPRAAWTPTYATEDLQSYVDEEGAEIDGVRVEVTKFSPVPAHRRPRPRTSEHLREAEPAVEYQTSDDDGVAASAVADVARRGEMYQRVVQDGRRQLEEVAAMRRAVGEIDFDKEMAAVSEGIDDDAEETIQYRQELEAQLSKLGSAQERIRALHNMLGEAAAALKAATEDEIDGAPQDPQRRSTSQTSIVSDAVLQRPRSVTPDTALAHTIAHSQQHQQRIVELGEEDADEDDDGRRNARDGDEDEADAADEARMLVNLQQDLAEQQVSELQSLQQALAGGVFDGDASKLLQSMGLAAPKASAPPLDNAAGVTSATSAHAAAPTSSARRQQQGPGVTDEHADLLQRVDRDMARYAELLNMIGSDSDDAAPGEIPEWHALRRRVQREAAQLAVDRKDEQSDAGDTDAGTTAAVAASNDTGDVDEQYRQVSVVNEMLQDMRQQLETLAAAEGLDIGRIGGAGAGVGDGEDNDDDIQPMQRKAPPVPPRDKGTRIRRKARFNLPPSPPPRRRHATEQASDHGEKRVRIQPPPRRGTPHPNARDPSKVKERKQTPFPGVRDVGVGDDDDDDDDDDETDHHHYDADEPMDALSSLMMRKPIEAASKPAHRDTPHPSARDPSHRDTPHASARDLGMRDNAKDLAQRRATPHPNARDPGMRDNAKDLAQRRATPHPNARDPGVRATTATTAAASDQGRRGGMPHPNARDPTGESREDEIMRKLEEMLDRDKFPDADITQILSALLERLRRVDSDEGEVEFLHLLDQVRAQLAARHIHRDVAKDDVGSEQGSEQESAAAQQELGSIAPAALLSNPKGTGSDNDDNDDDDVTQGLNRLVLEYYKEIARNEAIVRSVGKQLQSTSSSTLTTELCDDIVARVMHVISSTSDGQRVVPGLEQRLKDALRQHTGQPTSKVAPVATAAVQQVLKQEVVFDQVVADMEAAYTSELELLQRQRSAVDAKIVDVQQRLRDTLRLKAMMQDVKAESLLPPDGDVDGAKQEQEQDAADKDTDKRDVRHVSFTTGEKVIAVGAVEDDREHEDRRVSFTPGEEVITADSGEHEDRRVSFTPGEEVITDDAGEHDAGEHEDRRVSFTPGEEVITADAGTAGIAVAKHVLWTNSLKTADIAAQMAREQADLDQQLMNDLLPDDADTAAAAAAAAAAATSSKGSGSPRAASPPPADLSPGSASGSLSRTTSAAGDKSKVNVSDGDDSFHDAEDGTSLPATATSVSETSISPSSGSWQDVALPE